MKSPHKLMPFVALALAVAGCQGPAPVVPPVTVASQASQQPAIPAPSSLVLPGRAETPDGPLANATVTAFAIGESTPLATTTTDAGGAFSLALPPGASGRLLKVVTTLGGTSLVATTMLEVEPTSPLRLLQVQPGIRIDLATTVLALALLPRLTALAAANPSPQALSRLMRQMVSAADEAIGFIQALPAAQLTSFLTMAGPLGEGLVPAAVANLVTTGSPAFAEAFRGLADEVGAAIKERVAAGAVLPTGVNTDTLVFGNVTSIVPVGTTLPTTNTGVGNTNGGTSGPSATVGIAVTPGDENASVAVTVRQSHPAGSLIGYQAVTAGSYDSLDAVGDGAGGLWVSSGEAEKLFRYSAAGVKVAELTLETSSFDKYRVQGLGYRDGTRLVPDHQGGVWVLYSSTPMAHHVSVDAQGALSVEAVALEAGSYGFTAQPDGQGGLWVLSSERSLLQHIRADNTLDTPASVGTHAYPKSLARDGAGGVWCTNTANDQVQRFVLTGGAVVEDADARKTISGSDGLVEADGQGGLWVLDGHSASLYHILAGTFALSAPLTVSSSTSTPRRRLLVSDGQGGVWLNAGVGTLAHVSVVEGVPGIDATGIDASYTQVRAAAADARGDLWAFDQSSYALRRFTHSDGSVTVASAAEAPDYISAILFVGDQVWTVDEGGNLARFAK